MSTLSSQVMALHSIATELIFVYKSSFKIERGVSKIEINCMESTAI